MSIAHRFAFLLLLLSLAGPAGADDPPAASFALRPDVELFVADLAERHAFDAEELRRVFSMARREEGVLEAMRAQPRQADSWQAYRAQFVNERLVRAGLDFWTTHAHALARARATYGVPEEIIIAIIGIETFYGRNTGRWRVIDALATLAFDYPPRAPFFRGELESYLLFARDLNLDVFSVRGSYAGAIGIPQFMPGSYLRYAVDFDGDGSTDLRANPADAIGSVANFLLRHGWQPGEPVQLRARVNGEDHAQFVSVDPAPRHTLLELSQAGVQAGDAALPAETRAVLLRLQTPERPAEYRLGLQNFYVLTRYNRSLFYGMSVAELAEELRAARRKRRAGASG